jgi:hypothetical protein
MQGHKQIHPTLLQVVLQHVLILQSSRPCLQDFQESSSIWPCRPIRHRSTRLACLRLSTPDHYLIILINMLPQSTCTLVPTMTRLPFPSKTTFHSLTIWIINNMATRLNPTTAVVRVRHLQRERMERQVQRMERRNHTFAKYAKGDSRQEDICRGIRGYIQESRRSCAHSQDVRLGQAGRITYSSSMSNFSSFRSRALVAKLCSSILATGHIFRQHYDEAQDQLLVQPSMRPWSLPV